MQNLFSLPVLLKNKRTALGFTQVGLAQKSKISLQNIQLIESGRGNPSFDTLVKLFEALEIEITFSNKAFDWDLLISLGLPLSAKKEMQIALNRDSLVHALSSACHDLEQNPDQIDYDRKKLSVEAMLLSLNLHYTKFYASKIKSKPNVHGFYPKEITGHHIKLKRIILDRISKFL